MRMMTNQDRQTLLLILILFNIPSFQTSFEYNIFFCYIQASTSHWAVYTVAWPARANAITKSSPRCNRLWVNYFHFFFLIIVEICRVNTEIIFSSVSHWMGANHGCNDTHTHTHTPLDDSSTPLDEESTLVMGHMDSGGIQHWHCDNFMDAHMVSA